MDLINKDLVIAELTAKLNYIRQCTPGCDGNVNFSYGFLSGFEKALEMVKEIPLTRGGAWVLPDEQLPEEGADVLVTVYNTNWPGIGPTVEHRSFTGGAFKVFDAFAGDDHKGGYVVRQADRITAWMYEPEAYDG